MKSLFAATLALFALFALTACSRQLSPSAASWWAHVEALSTDEMEGRNTGSEGYRKAAEYVAGQFAKYGVEPGNGATYFHSVGFIARTVREDECVLELIEENGTAEELTLGTHAQFGMSQESALLTEADLVFVGYGLKVPEIGHDDFAGRDLKGKVAVYLAGAPKALTGPLRAHAQSTEVRWANMREAGIVGQVYLQNPKNIDVPWERSTLRRLTASMTLADPALDKTPGRQLQITWNPEHAELLFAGTEHTYASLLELADAEETLPHFDLPRQVRAKVAYDTEELTSDNVVGILPGSDPELQEEFVVLSGHLDGLGIGGAINGDEIYNGAMDNASGIATMIEIARIADQEGIEIKRSLVLLAVTGEEKGLLGSRAYAVAPTVPADAIVANVNMDMYLPIFEFTHLVTYGIDESDLGDYIPALADKYDVAVQPDPQPDRNIFIRSDQYNFVLAGVPALSFKFGAEPGSANEAAAKAWLTERYHAPSDDLAQPVDKEAAAKFTRLLLDLCVRIANAPERPEWKADSFFKRFQVERPAATAATAGASE